MPQAKTADCSGQFAASRADSQGLFPAHLDYFDYVQEGTIGLNQAVERFDLDKGCLFSTYADPWIRQAITHAIRKKARTVAIPAYLVERKAAIVKYIKAFEVKHSRQPTFAEIAEHLELKEYQVRWALSNDRAVESLDRKINETPIHEFIPDSRMSPAEMVDRDLTGEYLEYHIGFIDPTDRAILEANVGVDGPSVSMSKLSTGFYSSYAKVRKTAAIRRLRSTVNRAAIGW